MAETNEQTLYLEANEAARVLGVSVSTLYSYVSRKGIRSFPSEGTRRRRYWRADIEGIRTGTLPVPQPDTDMPLVRDTQLTLLTAKGMYYRGVDVVALANGATLEDVAALLWQVPVAETFQAGLPLAPRSYTSLATALKGLSPLHRALSLLPAIEHANPKSYDLSEVGFARAGAGVLRWFAAILVGASRPSEEPIHAFLARHLAANRPEFVDLVRRALVLAADHEFEPTVYAVRAAANTGITPYAAAMVGLIAGRGQRLRQNRAVRVANFVKEMLESDDPTAVVVRLYRLGEGVPGFEGGGPHSLADPRSEALLGAMRDALADDPDFQKFAAAINAATELTAQPPGFIVPIVFLGNQMGLTEEPLAFTTAGRLVGWLAHALEQFKQRSLVRPRAAYVGRLPNGAKT
jgi:citrate synthase